MHIIVVEDDERLGAAIKRALERLTYTVMWLKNGNAALEALRQGNADLMLLDLGLPAKGGIEVLRESRRKGIRTPILVMTARDRVEDRIEGLDAGADDYMVKPFHLDELAARIRSLIRRAQGLADNLMEAGPIRLNLSSLEVTLKGEHVDLTRRELAVLQTLITRAGSLVQRESIERSVFGAESDVGPNALEVLVHSLRRKLGPETIRTVRGFGYMLPGRPG